MAQRHLAFSNILFNCCILSRYQLHLVLIIIQPAIWLTRCRSWQRPFLMVSTSFFMELNSCFCFCFRFRNQDTQIERVRLHEQRFTRCQAGEERSFSWFHHPSEARSCCWPREMLSAAASRQGPSVRRPLMLVATAKPSLFRHLMIAHFAQAASDWLACDDGLAGFRHCSYRHFGILLFCCSLCVCLNFQTNIHGEVWGGGSEAIYRAWTLCNVLEQPPNSAWKEGRPSA
jgi:hypothetical protein